VSNVTRVPAPGYHTKAPGSMTHCSTNTGPTPSHMPHTQLNPSTPPVVPTAPQPPAGLRCSDAPIQVASPEPQTVHGMPPGLGHRSSSSNSTRQGMTCTTQARATHNAMLAHMCTCQVTHCPSAACAAGPHKCSAQVMCLYAAMHVLAGIRLCHPPWKQMRQTLRRHIVQKTL
jgi:hypothetical protein